jgi:hypothetical protein
MVISTGGVAVAVKPVKLLSEPGEIILFSKRTSIIITQNPCVICQEKLKPKFEIN